jgi:hypothetical protein
MNEKRPPTIETIKAVVANREAVKLRFAEDSKPMRLDLLTASALSVVYDALSPDNQAKIRDLIRTKRGLLKFVDFSWKHVRT